MFTEQAFGNGRWMCSGEENINKLEVTAGQIESCVLLSVTLVVWMIYKSWTLVMELTTHTWPRRQRSSGKVRYKQVLQLMQDQ